MTSSRTGEGATVIVVACVATLCALSFPTAALVGLALVAVVGTAVLSLRDIRVAWCVLFLAVCANGASVDVAGATFRPEYFVVPLFVAALVAHHRREGTPFRSMSGRERTVAGAMIVWVLIAVMTSSVVAPSPLLSLRSCVQFLVGLVVFFPLLLSSLDRVYALRSGTVILSSISTGSIGYWLLDPSRRVSGLAFEYNIMGSLCAAWLGVMYYYVGQRLSNGTPIMDRRLGCAAVPIVIALLLTETRAAWGALLVIVLFAACRVVGRYPISVIAATMGLCLGAAALAGVRDGSGEDTLLWRISHLTDFDSGTGAYRMLLWQDAITQIGARDWSFLWGTGANSFSQFNPVDPTFVGAAYLSSIWLGLLYDVGALGSIAFLVTVAGIVSRIPRPVHAIPLIVSLAACASLTNILWFAFPWVFLALVAGPVAQQRPVGQQGAQRRKPRGRRTHRRRLRAQVQL